MRLSAATFVAAGWVLSAAFSARAAESAAVADAPLPEKVQFNRDVRPILSENCSACHGFDKAKRKADLRLDTRAGALHDGGNGAALVPGKPAESQLLVRILSDDPDEVMPPPKAKKPPITTRQKAILKRWIEQGGAWEEHWSFLPVARPAVPAVKDARWARNPIDAFVRNRLERDGLKPTAEADRNTLVRRVTLDLTGLPPTPGEVDAFLADKSPDAYEKVVDRLLSSVRHGERMALEWLDAARYADTHGYHIDSGRDMTRWREWVIDAFHKNKPYDAFTVEQLAGDLLPSATLDQRVASGFNRNHMVNFEGGAIAEEYRTAYVLDRTNTTATVWLGLTAACTQCHDHKYDPITQKEYFELYAFFNNVAEKGLDGTKGNAVPFITAPTDAQRKTLETLAAKIAAAEARLTGGPDAEADAAQAEWEKTIDCTVAPAPANAVAPAWRATTPTEMRSEGGATLARQPDGSILVSGPNPSNDAYVVTLPAADLKRLAGVRLEALPHKSFAGGGPGRSVNGNAVLTGVTVAVTDAAGKPTPVKLAKASASFSQDGFDVAGAIDERAGSAWAIYPQVGRSHEAVFEPAAAVDLSVGARVVVTLAFKSQHARHQLGHFRLSLTDVPPPPIGGKAVPALAAAMTTPPAKRTPAQATAVRDYFRKAVWPAGKALAAELQSLKAEREAVERAVPSTMVMQELEKPRDTFVFVRGAYDKPGERVTPGVPAFLPPLPKDAPANRLSLAKWLVDRNHPLTSRVTVNRYWQMVFGSGLVRTTEDFGTQGEAPSHPELLDWLAADFMESGWDVRRLIRSYVTSATYRQAAVVTKEQLATDPENRLLGRGTRYRLQAEFIRDQALAASGLLDGRVGGQSVSPYQPAGLWEELMSRNDGAKWTAQVYVQSKGADLYRRTMYTFWKRTSPPPTLSTFDAPDRELCTVKRSRTNTPLQALVLMNDPTYVEAARKLAERALTEPPAGATDAERLTFAFRAVVARPPRAEEAAVLIDLLAKQRAKFAADKAAAAKLLAVGESPRDARLEQSELAAWATVGGVILNLDEAVTRG